MSQSNVNQPSRTQSQYQSKTLNSKSTGVGKSPSNNSPSQQSKQSINSKSKPNMISKQTTQQSGHSPSRKTPLNMDSSMQLSEMPSEQVERWNSGPNLVFKAKQRRMPDTLKPIVIPEGYILGRMVGFRKNMHNPEAKGAQEVKYKPNMVHSQDQASQYLVRKMARGEEMKRVGTPMQSVDDLGTDAEFVSLRGDDLVDMFRNGLNPDSEHEDSSENIGIGVRDINHTEDLVRLKQKDLKEQKQFEFAELEMQRQQERVDRHQQGIDRLKDQLRTDFNILQTNLAQNMKLMQKEGIDYEDVFKEDTEEIAFNFAYDIPLTQTAIAKQMTLDVAAVLKLVNRKKNMDIQASEIADKVPVVNPAVQGYQLEDKRIQMSEQVEVEEADKLYPKELDAIAMKQRRFLPTFQNPLMGGGAPEDGYFSSQSRNGYRAPYFSRGQKARTVNHSVDYGSFLPQIKQDIQEFHPDHYLLQNPIEPNGPGEEFMVPYDGSGMRQDDVKFLVDMLRRKQKADITRVIREEEKHEQTRNMQAQQNLSIQDREYLKKAFGFERAKAQNRILRIKNSYDQKIQQLLQSAQP